MIIQPSILVLAIKAVSRLIVSVAIGYVFTKKGIITQGALTAMSKLIYYIFQPALLFVQVTSTVASPGGGIDRLLVLPPFALVQVSIGIVLGLVLERVTGLKPASPESRELRMSSSFGNAGVLPFLFVEAMFPNLVEMETATAFASFYLIGWSPTFWTLGYVLLAGKPQVAATVLPSSSVKNLQFLDSSSSFKVLPWCRRMVANPTTKKLFAPPFIGALAGLIIGALPCTNKLLVEDDAHFSPIMNSLRVLGRGFLPSAILVLAGSLAKAQSASSDASQQETPQGRNVFYRKVTAIMIARFLLMPVITIGLLVGGFRAGIIPVDRLLWFVLLLEGCMPPAQNSVVILQIAERPDLAGSLAKTLAAVYIFSAVPIAILLSTMLQFATEAEMLWA